MHPGNHVSPLNYPLWIFFVAASTCLAQQSERRSLFGIVRDVQTNEPLSAANVRVLGTSRGTITNAGGEYTLTLEPGEYRLLFTMLGYGPDTAVVHLLADQRHDVFLEPSVIILPEIIVSSEDPAIEIIRRAIANKQHWIERLHSYEMRAFTRQTIYRDTAVAGINESFTTGYWQQGDTLREIVRQRRQTANIPDSYNLASVGRILNFSDEEITFIGYRFVGPTARDALDYYDYRLLRTRSSHGQDIYEIRMLPRSRTVPLFDGTISIAGNSYALVGVDVRPNVAFTIPFTKEIQLRYRQQFGLYESTFWMPNDIRIEAGFTIGFMGLTIPRIGLEQTSVISDYSINTAIPDSVFKKPRLVIDSSAARFDSSYWATNAVLPLSPLEQRAYHTLDSAQSLDVQFRPSGAAVSIGSDAGLGKALSFADITFNRVEGFHLGGQMDLDSLSSTFSASAGLAYGFSDRLWTYRLGGTYYPGVSRIFGIGAEAFRRVDHAPDRGYFTPFDNLLSSLLAKEDYRDYFRAEGWSSYLTWQGPHALRGRITYTSEREDSLSRRTNFSIFYPSRLYRTNIRAQEGMLRSLRLDVRLGADPVPLDLILGNSMDISAEHSSPRLTGGDFDFTRLDGVLTLNIPTFAQSYLLKPGFRIRASAGTSSGSLPVQRWFSLESALASDAPFGVLRAARIREFSGTGYAAITVEHNFRTLPFLALGIPFLYEHSLELIVFGSAAHTWAHDNAVSNTTAGLYGEAGFSLSRIFDLFRADFTWRVSSPRAFCFTVGIAPLL